MLFNIEKDAVKTMVDCLECKAFDKKLKKCNGIGKICFEYDEKTQTLYDNITKLPMHKKGE